MAELLVRETDRQTDSPAAAKTTDTQHVDAALAAMLAQSGISSLAPSLAAHGFTTAEDVLELAQQEQYLAELVSQLGLTLRDKMKLDKMLKTLTGGASSAAGAGAAVSEPQPPTPKPTMSKKKKGGASSAAGAGAALSKKEALALAVQKGYIKSRADPQKKDGDGMTALHKAAAQGKEEGVSLLIAAGVAVDAKTKLGFTPLMSACGQEGTVRLLVEHRADVNAKNNFGGTPLMSACCNEGTARLLVEHRADVNAKNNYGHTPLSHAIQCKYEAVAGWLRSIGAKE